MKELIIVIGLVIQLITCDANSHCGNEEAKMHDCHMNALTGNRCFPQARINYYRSKSLVQLRKECEKCPCCLHSSTYCVQLTYEKPATFSCPGFLKYYKDYSSMKPLKVPTPPPKTTPRPRPTTRPTPRPPTRPTPRPPTRPRPRPTTRPRPRPPTTPPGGFTCPPCPCSTQGRDIGVDTRDLIPQDGQHTINVNAQGSHHVVSRTVSAAGHLHSHSHSQSYLRSHLHLHKHSRRYKHRRSHSRSHSSSHSHTHSHSQTWSGTWQGSWDGSSSNGQVSEMPPIQMPEGSGEASACAPNEEQTAQHHV